jgi:hypothetical protein
MKKLIRFALLGLVLFSGACHQASSDSEVKRLLVNKFINKLSFARVDKDVFIADGNRVLEWAHEAPTVVDDEIHFKGTTIGHMIDGYFCNGPYVHVCDANIYKLNPSTIVLRTGNTAPPPGSNIIYVTADTTQLSNMKFKTPINGIAAGTCEVKTDKGTVTMDITAVHKPAYVKDGIEVDLVVVSTPIWEYKQGRLAPTAEMKVVERFYEGDPSRPQRQNPLKEATGTTMAERFALFR